MTRLTDDQIAEINALIEERVQYEEEHRDAGDAYSHLLAESWHSEHDRRLAEQLAELGIDHSAVDFDQLAEDVIYWAEMVPSRVYDRSPSAGQILLDSYRIGEIEMQISAEELGIDFFTSELIEELNRSCDAFFRWGDLRSCFAYVTSDSCWDSQIGAETVRELIAELIQRAA
jgi:hypothetical protein